ncbi:MAG: hypothetical protein M9887_07130 [Chitinophagales bacterium]|nr:hypothetical protein [Chitinophagales bacterium]
MKKKLIALSAVFMLSMSIIFAQKGKVNSAEYSLNNGELAKAKTFIDDAFKDESMNSWSKAWLIKGNVYASIYEQRAIHSDIYSTTPEPLETAKDAFFKALELEEKPKSKDKIAESIYSVGINIYNHGLGQYQANDFEGAYNSFKEKVAISDYLNENGYRNEVDTMGLFTLALAAYNSQKIDEAYAAAQRLNQLNNKKEDFYQVILDVYKAKGDQSGFEKVLKEGKALYPNNSYLMYAEVNMFLEQGKLDLLEGKLKKLIKLEPDNKNLYLVLGTVYDKKGDSQSAESMYNKALQIDPEYFDAYVNKASLYNNEANDIIQKMNDENDAKKYEALKDQRDNIFKNKILPLLTKAYTIDPNSATVKQALKEIYARLDMLDELKKLGK